MAREALDALFGAENGYAPAAPPAGPQLTVRLESISWFISILLEFALHTRRPLSPPPAPNWMVRLQIVSHCFTI